MIERIGDAIAGHHLTIMGMFHTKSDDPDGLGTMVLVGPGDGFWDHFTSSDEYQDEKADPLDRWSLATLGLLAQGLSVKAYFPFGGPPHHPFIEWAKRSGAHPSPTGLLVHGKHGLMVSYRAALWTKEHLNIPNRGSSPCESCEDKPCLLACPVDAFGSGTYDVPACKKDMARAGNDCKSQGCAVRRACTLSLGANRQSAQSAFHMEAFL